MTCKLRTTSLKDRFPDEIFVSTQEARARTGLSRDTLDRHRNDLIEVGLPEFEWYFYGKGYDYKSLEAIWQYAQLVKMMGKARAKDEIKQHMEEFWYEKNR